MNITDNHIDEFIEYTVDKMCKKDPSNKNVSNEVKRFYSIFYEEDPIKIRSLFKNQAPMIDDKPDRRYLRRLGKEFHLIRDKGFYRVFYQVIDILRLTHDMIHVIRGSSGSSVICYLTGITHIDPIKNNISLARFMHILRDDMPDIDMDFPTHLREEVYARIFTKYEGRVARISNHVHYGQKTALKQALKNNGVRGFISKEFNYRQLLKDRLEIDDEDELRELEKKVIEEARIYNGLEKHTSLHCGGIFITDKPIPADLVLHEIESNGVRAVQVKLDKDETEDSGFIKIDILSNRGLSQVTDIYAELRKRDIVLPSFECLPIESRVMVSLFENNIGITYAESRGMYKIFRRMKPQSIDDISIALALIRPAAAANGQKSEYLRSINQPADPTTDSTRPWVIYDDDAIVYIQKLLNIDESQADIYRKAFSKNSPKTIVKRKEFYGKMVASKKYTAEQVDEVITQLECLQEYSFCKSHSYSYAYLVYALAYLKYYYPREFWKATLNHCHSSFRSWVHYREASLHLELTHMNRPYRISIDGRRLIPSDGSIQPRLFSKPNDDFYKLGYWCGRDFMPGMYFIINEVKDKKTANFRGIVATYRPYYDRSPQSKCRKITFITLGYDNGKYLDIIAHGHYPLSKFPVVQGHGEIEGDYINCKRISLDIKLCI
jgi:DNA polymerase III alpha subunit